jgi:hypothetical protein
MVTRVRREKRTHAVKTLIQTIQDVLSPNLIYMGWQAHTKGKPLAGYCYIASEALYHLWAKEKGYKPARLWVHVGGGWEVSHWFLRRGEEALDITASQFGKIKVPYHRATGCGFLTKRPSDGAAEIIRRVEEARNL